MFVRVFTSIRQIEPREWRRVEDQNSPFANWEFFDALESSQSLGDKEGLRQVPLYLTLWQKEELLGACVLYEKNHSYGEYIFDWNWAEAARVYQIPYYPKLVCAIPFTPASCLKLLTADPQDEKLKKRLVEECLNLMSTRGQNSLHFLFTSESENKIFKERGLILRESYQYHWANKNYYHFEDFLKTLKGRKAKQIRRERQFLKDIEIEILKGEGLSEADGIDFYPYYLKTIEAKRSMAYLNQEFFRRIFATMASNIVLLKAFRGGVCLAQSLFFIKGNRLFGRYWGSSLQVDFLHFELCYYQGIEMCINQRLAYFEAGAQGEHKLLRGLVPTKTYSAYYFREQSFGEAVERVVEEEKRRLDQIFFLKGQEVKH